MKLSLWQQFSSNHSGFFWVVGTFDSITQAKSAYDALREMLSTIDRWHREHPQESWNAFQNGQLEPLPPEQDIATLYDVKWPFTIDWTGWASYGYQHPSLPQNYASKTAARLIDQAVFILGRTTVIQNPDQTWMPKQPFDSILAKLGAQTMGYDHDSLEEEINYHPEPQVSFTAPNIAIANQIKAALDTYLAGDLASLDNPPPWHDETQNYAQVLGNSMLLKPDVVQNWQRLWQNKYELSTRHVSTPYGLEMPTKRLALQMKPVEIKQDGLHFVLRDIRFHNAELGAYALIAWLEANHCTEIDFIYAQTRS